MPDDLNTLESCDSNVVKLKIARYNSIDIDKKFLVEDTLFATRRLSHETYSVQEEESTNENRSYVSDHEE